MRRLRCRERCGHDKVDRNRRLGDKRRRLGSVPLEEVFFGARCAVEGARIIIDLEQGGRTQHGGKPLVRASPGRAIALCKIAIHIRRDPKTCDVEVCRSQVEPGEAPLNIARPVREAADKMIAGPGVQEDVDADTVVQQSEIPVAGAGIARQHQARMFADQAGHVEGASGSGDKADIDVTVMGQRATFAHEAQQRARREEGFKARRFEDCDDLLEHGDGMRGIEARCARGGRCLIWLQRSQCLLLLEESIAKRAAVIRGARQLVMRRPRLREALEILLDEANRLFAPARMDQFGGARGKMRRQRARPMAGAPQRVGGRGDRVEAFAFLRRDVGDRLPGFPSVGIDRDGAAEGRQGKAAVVERRMRESLGMEEAGMARRKAERLVEPCEGSFGIPRAQERAAQLLHRRNVIGPQTAGSAKTTRGVQKATLSCERRAVPHEILPARITVFRPVRRRLIRQRPCGQQFAREPLRAVAIGVLPFASTIHKRVTHCGRSWPHSSEDSGGRDAQARAIAARLRGFLNYVLPSFLSGGWRRAEEGSEAFAVLYPPCPSGEGGVADLLMVAPWDRPTQEYCTENLLGIVLRFAGTGLP